MACTAYGQSADTLPPHARFHIGPYLAAEFSRDFVNLIIPTELPECGTLHHGNGHGLVAGLLFELPLDSGLALQLRGGVRSVAGLLSEPYSGDPVKNEAGLVVPGVIDQQIAYTALDASLSAIMRRYLGERLALNLGIEAASTLSHAETHRQVAVAPDNLLLANNGRSMDLQHGELLSLRSIGAAVAVGISYDLPIAATSTLTPEAVLSIPFINRSTDGHWFAPAARIGASLRFGIGHDEPAVVVPPVPDSPAIVQRTPTLLTSVITEPRVVGVRIDEYDSAEVLPLLNQIFFAETSADLRREYARLTPVETGTFNNAELVGSALDVYYQILNIVGRRLRENPGVTLTVNGYRNGRESEAPLALERAETVKRYLVDVWKIPERRIRTRGGGPPPNPARESTREGYEENARVELVPSDPNVLAPILRRHLQRIATPPAITFYPRALAEAGVASWRIETEQRDSRLWRTFGGYGAPPDSIVWNWRSDSGELPTLPMQLSYRFSVTDSSGRTTTTAMADIDVNYQSVQKKLEHRQSDTTIESFSILLFNFDSPKISASDQELLRVIGAAIKSGASVQLAGYTDSLGDAAHNHDLATMRAREVERILERLLPRDAKVAVDEDRGGERERFPYTTPEGRSHCRTVIIDVRTPTHDGGL